MISCRLKRFAKHFEINCRLIVKRKAGDLNKGHHYLAQRQKRWCRRRRRVLILPEWIDQWMWENCSNTRLAPAIALRNLCSNAFCVRPGRQQTGASSSARKSPIPSRSRADTLGRSVFRCTWARCHAHPLSFDCRPRLQPSSGCGKYQEPVLCFDAWSSARRGKVRDRGGHWKCACRKHRASPPWRLRPWRGGSGTRLPHLHSQACGKSSTCTAGCLGSSAHCRKGALGRLREEAPSSRLRRLRRTLRLLAEAAMGANPHDQHRAQPDDP